MLFDNPDRRGSLSAGFLGVIAGLLAVWPVRLDSWDLVMAVIGEDLCANSQSYYCNEQPLDAPSHSFCLFYSGLCGTRLSFPASDRAVSFLSQYFDGWKIETDTVQLCFPGNPFCSLLSNISPDC